MSDRSPKIEKLIEELIRELKIEAESALDLNLEMDFCPRCHSPLRQMGPDRCELCGKMYKKRRKGARFCSAECQAKWYYHAKKYRDWTKQGKKEEGSGLS